MQSVGCSDHDLHVNINISHNIVHGFVSCAAADADDVLHCCRLPYGMLQRRWFTNAADGNTVTMASGVGSLIYITTTWVSDPGVHRVYREVLSCGAWLQDVLTSSYGWVGQQ
jgi:hypothetical protein